MIGNLKLFVIALAMVFAWSASAQDQSSDEAADTEEAAPAADGNDPGDTGLSMGTADGEEGEPEVGQTYVADAFGDWQLRCVKSEGEKDPCQLYQLLKDEEGNSVAEFSMFNLPEGQQAAAGATIITPLETLLTAELRLAVDGGQARRYPYSFCSGIGCFARVGFTDGEVDTFRRGARATLAIVPAADPETTVLLSVSLTGFTDGWNAMVAANAE